MAVTLAPELIERLHPRSDSGLTRTRQLYLGLYGAIIAGELPAGTQLPPVRELAGVLGIGRNTVLEVYGQLGDEGLLSAQRRRGTRVIHQASPPSTANEPGWSMSRRAGALPPMVSGHAALMPGEPDVDLFPAATWRRAMARAAHQPAEALRYRMRPLPGLQQAIARWLATYRSFTVASERILVTASTRQSLAVAATLFADQGDQAWVESPGYRGAADAFTQLGLEPIACAVDSAGMVPPKSAPPPRLVYLTPCFQFPTGVPLGPARRDVLLELSATHGSVLFEDDYDSEFRDDTQPRPALAAAAGHARVLHAGTFSKLLFPAARVAWLVVPEEHVEAANRCLRVLGGGHQTVVQRALTMLLDNGDVARHLQRARVVYARRREVLHEALERSAVLGNTSLRAGSLNGVLELGQRLDLRAVEAALAKARLGAVPLERMRWHQPRPRHCRALVLGLGNVDATALPATVTRLAQAIAAAADGD